MKDRIVTIPARVWGTGVFQDVLVELSKLVGLFVLVMLLLGVVVGAQLMGGKQGLVDLAVVTGFRGGGFNWRTVWGEIYQQPEVNKQPWEISLGEMNRNRLVYNWTSKPGMRLLAWQMVSCLLGIALIIHKTRLWAVVGVERKGDPSTAKHRIDALRAQDDVLDLGSIANTSSAGVVSIRALQGVIYISGVPNVAAAMQEFGMWLKPAWVVVK